MKCTTTLVVSIKMHHFDLHTLWLLISKAFLHFAFDKLTTNLQSTVYRPVVAYTAIAVYHLLDNYSCRPGLALRGWKIEASRTTANSKLKFHAHIIHME